MRDAGQFHAGTASVSIAPPLGVDMVGFLRRTKPASDYGRPLEANALVLDDGATRIAIVALDVIGTPREYGRRLRESIAAAAGCDPGAVLVNSSHTHAAPPLPRMPKLGGRVHDCRDQEVRWAESLVDLASSAAAAAANRLQPARLGAARTDVELGVNRRQRVDGNTILGWNPEELCDRDVAVLRVDAIDGKAITTVVVYACHPVVVGPEVAEISSDFVGPLRERVRAWTAGDCLFLQACAGNILPLEAFHDHAGPEFVFADRLALAALRARDAAAVRPLTPRQAPYRSAVPIGIWRLEADEGDEWDRTLAYVESPLEMPLQTPPTLEEIRALQRDLETQLTRLRADGAPLEAQNPLELHIQWAQAVERRVADGTVETSINAPLQVLRIGDISIAAFPCEPFCELGAEFKARAGGFPIALGYSNDLIGYVPTAREFPFGGYEPSVSQRHFGNPAPFDPAAGLLMVEQALTLAETLTSAGAIR